MTYILPNFSFYYLIRDLGEDIEDTEVQQVDGGQGLVRYVTTIHRRAGAAHPGHDRAGSFAGRATFFRTLVWTVAPLPLFIWLVMLLRLSRKPKAISMEKVQEVEELARIEAQILVPPSIWEARRQLNRQLSAMQDLSPSADAVALAGFERGMVLSLRDYVRAELPDVRSGDTALDMQRHVEGLTDGPRKEALRTLTARMVAYQHGLERSEPAPIESPSSEAASLEEALRQLRRTCGCSTA